MRYRLLPINSRFFARFTDYLTVVVLALGLSSVMADGSVGANGRYFLPSATEGVEYSSHLVADGDDIASWSLLPSGYNESSSPSSFAEVGDAKGWHADDACWTLDLPFKFPFYGEMYSQVRVNSNGTLNFDGINFPLWYFDELEFLSHPMVAVLWADLSTSVGDVYVSSSPDVVIVSWRCSYLGGNAVNAAATLFPNGRIVLSYGDGNSQGGFIGVSAGDGSTHLVSEKSSSGSMAGANDVVFTPQTLPDGLALAADGTVSGVCDEPGEYEFSVEATHYNGSVETIRFGLVVAENPTLRPAVVSKLPVEDLLNIAALGDEIEFSVETSHPGGGEVLVEWFLDGESVETGNSFRFVRSDDKTHSVKAVAFARDLPKTASSEWRVGVLEISDPESLFISAEMNAVLSVQIVSSESASVTWHDAETDAAVGSGQKLSLHAVAETCAYYAVAESPFGSVTSAVATVTCDPVPAVGRIYKMTGPAFAGNRLVLRAKPYGDLSGATFTWKRDGVTVATTERLDIARLSEMDFGTYTLTVANVHGTATSEPYVLEPAPSGAPVGWGAKGHGRTIAPEGLTGVAQIASGMNFNLGLTTNGTVTAWGYNGHGGCDVPAGLKGVSFVAAGGYDSMGAGFAVKTDGTVVAWGQSYEYHDNGGYDSGYDSVGGMPAGLSDVVQIAVGAYGSIALKSDGSVTTWGFEGQDWNDTWCVFDYTVPDAVDDVVSVAAGGAYVMALRADGTVAKWGSEVSDYYEFPEDLDDAVFIAVSSHPWGGSSYAFAVLADGSIAVTEHSWPSDIENVPVSEAGFSGMDVGYYHAIALDAEGEVSVWGDSGVFWNYKIDQIPAAVQSGALGVAAGGYHCTAILRDSDGDSIADAEENLLGRDPLVWEPCARVSLSGRVAAINIDISGVVVELYDAAGELRARVEADETGAYSVSGLVPGRYFMKVMADGARDVWLDSAEPALGATAPFAVTNDISGVFTTLEPGQGTAYVQVVAHRRGEDQNPWVDDCETVELPEGTRIYIDMWPAETAANGLLDIGEVPASHGGFDLNTQPHMVTVKVPGGQTPAPCEVAGVELGMVEANPHFSAESGSVSVATDPAGAEVWIDYADEPIGETPLIVDNLAVTSASHPHVLLLRKDGFLRPRPVWFGVEADETTEISVPLTPQNAGGLSVAVSSVADGFEILLDYLPTGEVAPATIGGLDPASHGGGLWGSASHSIVLRGNGLAPVLPRGVDESSIDSELPPDSAPIQVNIDAPYIWNVFWNGGGTDDDIPTVSFFDNGVEIETVVLLEEPTFDVSHRLSARLSQPFSTNAVIRLAREDDGNSYWNPWPWDGPENDQCIIAIGAGQTEFEFVIGDLGDGLVPAETNKLSVWFGDVQIGSLNVVLENCNPQIEMISVSCGESFDEYSDERWNFSGDWASEKAFAGEIAVPVEVEIEAFDNEWYSIGQTGAQSGIDWGDGSFDWTAFDNPPDGYAFSSMAVLGFSHTYSSAVAGRTLTVTVSVTDKDGGTGMASFPISFPGSPVEPLPEGDLYVDAANGDDANDGLTWATALATLQAAAEKSNDGDVVLVAPGVYFGADACFSYGVTLRSRDGAETTILDGRCARPCLSEGATDAEGYSDIVIVGFTFRNGVRDTEEHWWSPPIPSGATLESCIIENCDGGSGGILRNGTVRNSIVRGCRQSSIYNEVFYDCEFSNCAIVGNEVACLLCSCRLVNCTVADNTAYGCIDEGDLFNCIVWGNRDYAGNENNCGFWISDWDKNAGGKTEPYVSPKVSNCGIEGLAAAAERLAGQGFDFDYAAQGCFEADPKFVDLANGDVRLRTGSPCIDAGAAEWVVGTLDAAGNPRVQGAAVDLGAYEGAVEGYVLSATAKNAGTVEPRTVIVQVGDSATFTATGSAGRPFMVWITNGVPAGSESTLTVSNVQSDCNIVAGFGLATFHVDAANGDDANDGLSWATAKASIQAAIDEAVDREGIFVKPGVYGPIDTEGKAVIIESTDGPDVTIIDGGRTNRCAFLGDNAGRGATLVGFMLRNGVADGGVGKYSYCGGGAYGGTLLDCDISGNCATECGGGVCDVEAHRCRIVENCIEMAYDDGFGGGASDSTLYSCLVISNSVSLSTDNSQSTVYINGGGVSYSKCHQCTIADNAIAVGILDGVEVNISGGGGAYGSIDGCILYGNLAEGEVSDYEAYDDETPEEMNLIGVDPLFVDRAHGDYRLSENSPAIDKGWTSIDAWKGAPDGTLLDTDLDGNPRVRGNAIDLGCYESPYTALDVYPDGNYRETVDGIEWMFTITNGEAVIVNWENGRTPAIPYDIEGELEIPSILGGCSVTSIEGEAFIYCGGLTSVTIPDTVTNIGAGAFDGCYGLASLTIPGSVTNIGDGAFIDCNGLMSIVVDEENPVYDSRNNCNAIIRTADDTLLLGSNTTTIHDTVTSIGCWAFCHYNGLASLTIPDSVTNIGDYAFYDCSGLTSVTIPDSVTSIGREAFSGCSGLTSVTIPDSVTSIGNGAFYGCSSLADLYLPVRFEGQTESMGIPEGCTVHFVSPEPVTLELALPTESARENAGALRCVVRRTGSLAHDLVVSVASSRPGDLSVPAMVTIPAGSRSASFTATPVDNAAVDGTRTATISVAADGVEGAEATLTILDDEVPALALSPATATIREGEEAVFTVSRPAAVSGEALTVYLAGISSSQAAFPFSVAIGAGETAASFAVSAVDDAAAEIDRDYTLRASAVGCTAATAGVTIADDDVPGVTLTLAPEEVSEGAGAKAAKLTVARTDTEDLSKPVTVQLAASPSGQIIVPSSLTIPANTVSVRADITTIDNGNVDGDRDVVVAGSIYIEACGCSGQPSSGGAISATLRILDNDVPSLRLSAEPQTMKEGLEEAGFLVLSCNAVLESDLDVSFSFDVEGEIDIPATATIPAGASSVRIPVQTLDDGAEDGSKIVSVYADATGYASGSTWILVTDQNLPDFEVVDVAADYTSIIAGETLDVSFTLENNGFADRAGGVSWAAYWVAGATAVLGSDAEPLATGRFGGPLAVGASTSLVARVTAPTTVGDGRFAVVADPDGEIRELDDGNNTGYGAVAAISPSYVAEVAVEGDAFLPGDEIVIAGSAVMTDGITPAAGVEVEIYFARDGFRRTLSATTAADGTFAVAYTLTAADIGHWAVGACYPGVGSTAEQDAIDVLGIQRTTSDYITWDLVVGDTVRTAIPLKNASAAALSGLAVEAVGAPAGCEVSFELAESLAGNTLATLYATVLATAPTDADKCVKFAFRITSAEGASLDIPAWFYARSPRAQLKATPASLSANMTVGIKRYITLNVSNIGRSDSGEISISGIVPGWMRVVDGDRLDNLAPGETASVMLELSPDETMTLNNPYTGSLFVGCSNGKGCYVPVSFKPVSEATGSIEVKVTDNSYWHLESQPCLAGATVRLYNRWTGETLVRGTTIEDGIVRAGDIPVGDYQLDVTAPKHSAYQQGVTINPGETTAVWADLDFQAITMGWEAKHTTVEDEYDVTLVLDYDTSVPSAVVKLTMPDELPELAEGESYAFTAIFENIGVIAAQEVSVSLPEIPGYEFAIADNGFTLPAGSSVSVPVIFKKLPSRSRLAAGVTGSRSASSGSVIVTETRCHYPYYYVYGEICNGIKYTQVVKDIQHGTCTTTTYIAPVTPSVPSDPSFGGSGFGGGGFGGGGFGGGSFSFSKTDCDLRITSLEEILQRLKDARENDNGCWDRITQIPGKSWDALKDNLKISAPHVVDLFLSKCAKQAWGVEDELPYSDETKFRKLGELMKDSYRSGTSGDSVSEAGFKRASQDETARLFGYSGEVSGDKSVAVDRFTILTDGSIRGDDGFKAALYFDHDATNYREGPLYIVYAGTDPDMDDIETDLNNYACQHTVQYDLADLMLKKLLSSIPPSREIVVCGHSLGGGLAQYAMLNNNLGNRASGYTYNSAGFCSSQIPDVTSCNIASKSIVNVRARNDPVSVIGLHIGSIYTLGSASGHGVSGATLNPPAPSFWAYQGNWWASIFAKSMNLYKGSTAKPLLPVAEAAGACVASLQISAIKLFDIASESLDAYDELLSAFSLLASREKPEDITFIGNDSADKWLNRLKLLPISTAAAKRVSDAIFGTSGPWETLLNQNALLSSASAPTRTAGSTNDEWLNATPDEIGDFLDRALGAVLQGEIPDTQTLRAFAPDCVSDEALSLFIERSTNTVLYLQGDTTIDISTRMDLEGCREALNALLTLDSIAIESGFASAKEMWEDAIDNLSSFLDGKSNSICARVKVELSQSVALAREAVEGTLTIYNGHDSVAMTDVHFNVAVKDGEGNLVATAENDGLFGITQSGLDGMAGDSILNGGVSISAQGTGVATVLFVPTPAAAGETPKPYYFGGTVTYTDPFTGETATVRLVDVELTVNPTPELHLDYFVQRDVYGDDPFTADVVEASLPAEIAVIVRNEGYGDANEVRISSVQPEVVENEKGLQIDFSLSDYSLDAMALNGATAHLGLNDVNLGTVAAKSSSVAQWWLTASIQGHFTGMDAIVAQRNSWGNPDTSLLRQENVHVHKLVRSIVADADTLPDFLVSEEPDLYGLPDTIYTAAGDVIDVRQALSVRVAGALSGSSPSLSVTVAAPASAWTYGYVVLPGAEGYEITGVTRSDGTELPARNAWITDRVFRDGADPRWEARLHIVDDGTAGDRIYSVTLAAKPSDGPSVAAFEGVAAGAILSAAPDAVTVVFSTAIDPASFDALDLTFHFQGERVADLSALAVAPEAGDATGTRFTVSGLASLCPDDGHAILTVQCAGIANLSGDLGSVGKSLSWTVAADTVPPAQIADLRISPDLGVSDSDGITCGANVTVLGTLPDDAATVEILVRWQAGAENTLVPAFAPDGASLSRALALPSSGWQTLVVRCADAAGNASETSIDVFIDTIALTATLSGAPEDDETPIEAVALAFSAQVLEGDVTLGKFSLTRDGAAVALEGVSLGTADNIAFTLSGLSALCAEDGNYTLSFNGAGVRKRSSGLAMSGNPLTLTWRYVNPDREPPTVTAVLFDSKVPQSAYTNGLLFSSVSVTFSEPVNVPDLIANGLIGRAARIDLLDAAGVVTGSVVAARSESSPHLWNAEANTLSWSIDLSAVPAGRARLTLDAGLISDIAGNPLSVDGYAAVNGLRAYALSDSLLAQVNVFAMPMWFEGELYAGEKTEDNRGKIRHYAANGAWSYLQFDGTDIEVPAQGCQGASVAFADMDGDGTVETYIGTATGDVLRYPGGETIASIGVSRAVLYAYDIGGDGRDELVTGGMDGRIRAISLNEETGDYIVTLLADISGLPLVVPNGRAAPVVADINNDGLADIVSGDTAGNVWAFLGDVATTPSSSSELVFASTPVAVFENDGTLADRSRLGYGDVDGDGISDLIVGRSDGSVLVMHGAEKPSPSVPFAVIGPPTLAEALDATDLVWTTGGAAGWAAEWSADASDGIHDARSGAIGNNTNSWIETTVEGFGTISFSWKVSCEERYDFAVVEIDGEICGRISGESGWEDASFALGSGIHTIRWTYRKGRSGTAGADAAWLDSVTWTPMPLPTLAEALDATNLVWTTGGDEPWEVLVSQMSSDGKACAVSGPIGDYGSSLLSTTVSGSGTLSFWWRVSCEDSYDWFDFCVDGRLQGSLTGESGWRQVSIRIAEGTHELLWEYWKDDMDEDGLTGDDMAFLDRVAFVPDEAVPPLDEPGYALSEFQEFLRENGYIVSGAGNAEINEAAAAKAANGVNTVWECYVAGISPTDEEARFEATIEIGADGKPVVKWNPPLSEEEVAKRTYRTYGKKTLDPKEEWIDVTDVEDLDAAGWKFFKAAVEMK